MPLRSGERRTFALTRFPILDGSTGVGFGGVIIDITERTRAERALREGEKQAALANRAKSEFVANMSHELRTPLNAVIGFSQIIKEQLMGPIGSVKYRDYASDIHESGQHLLDIINDILDLSKIESGSDVPQDEDVEIAELVRSVLTLVKGRAENGAVRLALEIPDGLPALRVDRRRLKQILVNLLTNGIKFTPADGCVTLKVWCRPAGGFVFQVADTGIGMALKDIPKALTPFGQVDSRPNRKYEGTGLGLPLTKHMVEMHGGSLELDSEIGVGTTATVRFPVERIAATSTIAEATAG